MRFGLQLSLNTLHNNLISPYIQILEPTDNDCVIALQRSETLSSYRASKNSQLQHSKTRPVKENETSLANISMLYSSSALSEISSSGDTLRVLCSSGPSYTSVVAVVPVFMIFEIVSVLLYHRSRYFQFVVSGKLLLPKSASVSQRCC